MKRFSIVAIMLFSIFASSCATFYAKQIDEVMNSWLGSTKEELLLQWGPPYSKYPDGKGGTIWTYQEIRQTAGSAYTNKYGYTTYRAPQQYNVVRQFFINAEGIIYAYRWQGI